MASFYSRIAIVVLITIFLQVHAQGNSCYILFITLHVAISTLVCIATESGVFVCLHRVTIANDSYVDVDVIGEGANALLCRTDKLSCCGEPPNRAGEWYFPNGTMVGIQGGTQDEFYRDRATQVVRLNHRQGTFTERGLFRCEVPDASNTVQTVYVNIGKF